MKVMIVVTHLLGTGHLVRALTLGRAFAAAGDSVQVVSGGRPVPHFDTDGCAVVQLPPVHSDGVAFTTLLTPDGRADDAYMTQRRDRLIAAFDSFGPDVLITELFPFGRRVLRDEFLALLTHARTVRHRPLICASIRDILAPPSKPAKAAFADRTVAAQYDAVLVHADPALTPLELSWPVGQTLAPFLHYTGFVAPAPTAPHPGGLGADEVLVSAGGGDVGDDVYDTALAAAAQDTARRWRLLVGGGPAAAEKLAQWQARAPVNATIEAARPEFRAMLPHAAASISLCGYNTALDVLQAGVPAVFVPFDRGGELEQGIRARALAQRAGIAALAWDDLGPERLVQAVDQVTAQPRPAPVRDTMQGAARTVEITRALVAIR